MSGKDIGTVVGAGIGFALGSWQIGAMAGGYLGGVIDPTIIKGPSIGDAQVQTTQAGAGIPKVFGHSYPLGVTLIDGDPVARKITTTEDVGKGATQKTKTEHFIATRAFLVCEGEISGYARIRRNGKLVYSTMPGDELDAESSTFASQITIYTGTETQGPDPSLEAIHGVGNTHYYRGRSYFVVRDDEEIGGAMNRYTVEVMACGEVTTTPADYLLALGPEFYYKLGDDPAADTSGNSHQDLTYFGSATPSGSGASFADNDSGVYAPTLTAMGMGGASAATILVKFRIADIGDPSDHKQIVAFINNELGGDYTFSIYCSGAVGMTLRTGVNNNAALVTDADDIGVGTTYVAGARLTGTDLELWLNGRLINSAPYAGTPFSGSSKFRIGSNPGYTATGFAGDVSHVVGYRRALTDGEMAMATYYVDVLPDDVYASPDGSGLFVDSEGNVISTAGATSIAECIPLWKDIVAEIALRASPLLPAVLDIEHMTDEVPCFVLGNPTLTGSDYVRTLCTWYSVDLVDYDRQLHAIRRGGPIVATFTEDDLLEVEEEDDDTRAPALDAYKRITVMYPDPANNYVSTPQTSPRTSPDITTNNQVTIECPIPFDAATMAQKVDVLQKVAFLQVEGGFKRAFPAEFSQFVPSDPVMFNDRRYIIVKASYDDSMVRFECQYDRPSAYNSQATPAVAPTPQPQTSNLKGPTILVAMNLPPLRTADNVPGIYVAAMGLLPGWPGCDVMLSLDGGITEVKVAEITTPAEIGELADDLAAGAEPAVVDLLGTGELESVTLAQIDARQNAAAIITAEVAEIIQFQTVDIDTSGHWELTDITRGELGTVDADHDAGDTFVTLTNAKFIPIDASHFGETIIIRGVTKGTLPANNPTVSLVYEGTVTIIDGGEIT